MITLEELIKTKEYSGFARTDFYPNDIDSFDEMLSGHYDGHYHGQLDRFMKGEKIEEIALRVWICTDTQVGLYLILLNDEPIAITYQRARRCKQIWSFVSNETFQTLSETWKKYAEDIDAPTIIDKINLSIMLEPNTKYTWETGPADEF